LTEKSPAFKIKLWIVYDDSNIDERLIFPRVLNDLADLKIFYSAREFLLL